MFNYVNSHIKFIITTENVFARWHEENKPSNMETWTTRGVGDSSGTTESLGRARGPLEAHLLEASPLEPQEATGSARWPLEATGCARQPQEAYERTRPEPMGQGARTWPGAIGGDTDEPGSVFKKWKLSFKAAENWATVSKHEESISHMSFAHSQAQSERW